MGETIRQAVPGHEKEGWEYQWIQGAAIPTSLLICGASAEFTLLEAAAGDGKPPLKKFSIVGYTGGLLRLSSWPYPVVVDLEGMTIPRQNIPALVDHDHTLVAGHTESIDKTQQRLKLAGVMSGYSDTEQTPSACSAREIVRLAANGFEWQASIGASPDKVRFIPEGESVKANGRVFQGPIYSVDKSTLAEISFCALGADMNTSATVAAAAVAKSYLGGGTPMTEFEKWLVAKGIDQTAQAALADPVKNALKASFDAEIKAAAPPEEKKKMPEGQGAFDKKMEAIEQENRRIEHIREVTAAHAASHIGNPAKVAELRELCEAAISDQTMTTDKFDLAMIRADRATVIHHQSKESQQITNTVVEAAFCRHTGLPDLEKRFKPDVLEATDKHFGHGGLGLQELIGMAAKRNGWRGHSVKSDLRRALKAAFREDEYQGIQASVGPSTYSIPNILSNVANLHIRNAFEATEQEWRKIAAIGSVNDYKEITTVALTGDFTYKKVPRGGEVEHAKFGDMTYGNKADVFAILIGIDEQDLVNDSAGALTSASRRVGRGGAMTMNDVFWAEWLDDAAFFPTDKSLGNYDDGNVDSMLTAVGLENMNSIFRSQTDPDGRPLGIRPKILLVPPALEGTALALMAPALTGSTNIWSNRFMVVSSDYLTNPLAWYLLANPQDLAAIEMVFLNGNQMPQTEQADMAIDRLGIVIRGKHSFGARKQEFRAGVKAKGAA